METEQIESSFEMLGVTAVEDLLQEEVASAISDFRQAGIKVWMLTGDKGETALQIGLACGLYDKNSQLFKLDSEEDEHVVEKLEEIAKKISEAELKTCFAICGSCLPAIFQSERLSAMIY